MFGPWIPEAVLMIFLAAAYGPAAERAVQNGRISSSGVALGGSRS